MGKCHDNAVQETPRDGCSGSIFLPESDLARRWCRSTRTIQRMRAAGTGPAYFRIGGSILYRLDDIKAFEAEARIAGSGQ